jgi:hypothetical protein
MTQIEFGAGVLWGTPLLNPDGTVPTNPTPTKFGILQEVSLNVEFQTKELYGGQQFPAAIGRGQGKITASAKSAQIIGAQWAQLFFGKAYAGGMSMADYNDNTGQAIPAGPSTITITPPGSGVFQADLGVVGADGNPLTKVASAPTTGQYSVNVATGVYTFATADAGQTVFINYQYSLTAVNAPKAGNFIVTSDLMGYSPMFAVDLMLTYYGKQLTMHLYQVTSSKLALPAKMDDFLIPQFDMQAFADSQNRVAAFSFSGG